MASPNRQREGDFMNYAFKQLDIVPLVKYYIEKINIVNILHKHLDKSTKNEIPVSQTLGILITNILASSKPLYQVSEWLADYTDGKAQEQFEANKYNDDRLGRALDVLYEANRQSIQTEIAAQVIKVHDLDTSKIHNDTTTISFAGAYEHQSEDTVQLKHGHNKDGRPDDKQIVYGLNITEDGHVPLSYHLYNGNQNDDTTHQPNWDALKDFLQKEDFIYIADCKLCSFANLQHIAAHGGKFITVIPSYHLESKSFIEKVKTGETSIEWSDHYEAKISRNANKPNVFKVYEGEKSREGYRIIWIYSSAKAKASEEFRNRHIEKAEEQLNKIKQGLNKRHLRCRERIEKEIQKATKNVKDLFSVDLRETTSIENKYIGRGKPSENKKPIESKEVTTFSLEWKIDTNNIEAAARTDGIYPLVTNTELSPVEVLQTYKNQSNLEKRFYSKKSVLEVAPVFLKKTERIEAILFLYFIALMIIGLIERHLRQEMQRNEIEALPILPSRMKTKSPTWKAIRNFFRNIHLLVIHEAMIVKDYMVKGLTSTHKQLLRLFGVPEEYYENLRDGWWIFSIQDVI